MSAEKNKKKKNKSSKSSDSSNFQPSAVAAAGAGASALKQPQTTIFLDYSKDIELYGVNFSLDSAVPEITEIITKLSEINDYFSNSEALFVISALNLEPLLDKGSMKTKQAICISELRELGVFSRIPKDNHARNYAAILATFASIFPELINILSTDTQYHAKKSERLKALYDPNNLLTYSVLSLRRGQKNDFKEVISELFFFLRCYKKFAESVIEFEKEISALYLLYALQIICVLEYVRSADKDSLLLLSIGSKKDNYLDKLRTFQQSLRQSRLSELTMALSSHFVTLNDPLLKVPSNLILGTTFLNLLANINNNNEDFAKKCARHGC